MRILSNLLLPVFGATVLGPTVLVACSGSQPASETPEAAAEPGPAQVAPAKGPSIVLVTLDTTRADHMGAYGYEAAETPVFDSMAQQGVRFERAYAAVPLTTPSHASMLTGEYPPEHGIRNNGDAVLPDSFQTLAEVLQGHGYETAASVSAFVTTRVWNLDQGFDAYFDEVHSAGPGKRWGQERPANEVVDDLVGWLDEGRQGDGAFFMWAHFYDAHHPYKPPEGFADRFEDPYDGEIAFVDSQIARLKDKVEAAAGDQGVVWIVVADHGESFDHQHDEVMHGLYVFDSTMHVPFVIRPAQPLAEPVVVAERAVSGVDVMPTALGMLGIEVPEGLDGVDLSSAAKGTVPERAPVYMEATSAQARFGYHPEIAAAEGQYKLIDTPSPALFDVVADPTESKNLVGTLPDVEARLRGVTQATFKPLNQDLDEVAPEVTEQLAALGYVSSDFEHAEGLSNIDVKDKSGVLVRLEKVRSKMGPGKDPRAAEAEYRAIVAAEPTLAEARLGLAKVLNATDRLPEGEEVLRQALELQPSSTVLRANLANNLAAQGRTEEGLNMMLSILERVPGDNIAQIGTLRMLTDMERNKQAIELARKWLVEKPEDPGLQAHLGILLAREGQYKEADEMLNASLRDEIPRQLVHRTIAGLEQLKGRPVMALKHYRLEQRNFPGQMDLWKDTAGLLMKQKRWEDAAADFARYNEAVPEDQMIRLGWAQSVFNLGDFSRAEEILAPALEAAPEQPDLLMLQANILAKTNRLDEGKAMAAKANQLKQAQIDQLAADLEERKKDEPDAEAPAQVDQ